MRRAIALIGTAALSVVAFVALALSSVEASSAPRAKADSRPDAIPLPDGFAPEGIVFGRDSTFYVGSLSTGAIFRGDAKTGDGALLVTSSTRGPALGLAYDARGERLFVAAGQVGAAVVYDATSGEELAAVQLSTEPSFVNDVTLTRDAAWFTDSRRPVLYRMSLADPNDVEEVALGGEFVFDPAGANANGIASLRRGRTLVIVHSPRGELYRVDPTTGAASVIDLDDETVQNGDGLVVRGRNIYVVQNQLNQVSVVRLDKSLRSGEIRRVITSPQFRIPSTADALGADLYVVNARFDTPRGADVDYDVVRVRR